MTWEQRDTSTYRFGYRDSPWPFDLGREVNIDQLFRIYRVALAVGGVEDGC